MSFAADLEIRRVLLDCGTKDVLAMLVFGLVGRGGRVEAALTLAVRRIGRGRRIRATWDCSNGWVEAWRS